jgi:hypothetical protein
VASGEVGLNDLPLLRPGLRTRLEREVLYPLTNYSFIMHTIPLAIVLALLLSSPLLSHASTIINNDVSVSASGGEGHVYIQTTHNGEIVEAIDMTSTSPIEYTHTYVTQGDETVNNETLIEILTTLLNELRALLAYYESLLN